MSRFKAVWSPPQGGWKYGAAIVAVATTVVAGLIVNSSLQAAPYVSLFICAILLAARLGGAGPGLFAAGLAVVAFAYFFVFPEHPSRFGSDQFLRIALFALASLFVVCVSAAQKHTAESLRRARDDLRRTVRQLENLNKSLQLENAERIRAEEASRQAERELKLIVDNIPAILATYHHDGSIDFVNQTWRTYTGLDQNSLARSQWGMAIHPDDLPRVEAAWRTHLPAGQPFDIEHRLRRHDGEYRWHWVRRVPHRNDFGEVVKWYGVAHDVEDQKRAERALQRSEAYLAEAQRLSQTGSFGWKMGTGGVFWSKELYRIMGVDETIKPTLELILQRAHPEDRKLVQQQLQRAARRSDRDQDYEHRLLMPDGKVKHVHVRAHRQSYPSGEEELVGALMDFTATHQAQDALHSAQAELAHVTRVTTLGEMSASIAHEVNQPLTAVVTNAESGLRWLGREVPDLQEARTALHQVVKNAHRASEVMRRIRDFAKKAEPEMTRLDINDIVEEAVTLVRREALGHGVATRLELASDLSPVLGDRIQLQQVIINLAVNGIQAMAAVRDRERLLVVRTGRDQSGDLLVAIEDVGTGVEPENVNRLFAAFYTTKPDGLGMGLSICRSILQAHGGRVWASRNDGHGMTFQFTISASGRHG